MKFFKKMKNLVHNQRGFPSLPKLSCDKSESTIMCNFNIYENL